MPGFTIEALPTLGAVRVVVDIRDDPDVTDVYDCQLFRSLVPPTDPDWYDSWVKVRVRPTYMLGYETGQYGSPWEMFNTCDVWYDFEAPLDVPLWYVVELPGSSSSYMWAAARTDLLTGDASEFDTSVSAWTADAGATRALNTTTPLFGAGSMRVTVTGASAGTGARAARQAVVAGRMYGLSGWVRSPNGGDMRMVMDWFTAGLALVSTSTVVQTTLAANTTTRQSGSVIAPATAVWGQPRIRIQPAVVAQYVDVDRVRMWGMGDPTVEASTTPVTLSSDDGGWLTDPIVPADSVRLSLLPTDGCDVDPILAGTQSGVIFAAHAAEGRGASGSRFAVVGSALPIPVTGIRKEVTSTLTLATVSFADRDRVHNVMASGRVTLLRLPQVYGITDRYLDVADITTTALSPDLRLPYRIVDVPYAKVGTPAGVTAGALATRIGDLDRYPTWTGFDAARLTTLDLLHGAGSTLGIVP